MTDGELPEDAITAALPLAERLALQYGMPEEIDHDEVRAFTVAMLTAALPALTRADAARTVRLQHIEEELTALVASWRSAGHIREYADAVERILNSVSADAHPSGGRIDVLSRDVSAEGLQLQPDDDKFRYLREAVAGSVRVPYVPLIDPDCRDGKCGSCTGGPCEHDCHQHPVDTAAVLAALSAPGAAGHAHYWRQTVGGLVCSCGATVTA